MRLRCLIILPLLLIGCAALPTAPTPTDDDPLIPYQTNVVPTGTPEPASAAAGPVTPSLDPQTCFFDLDVPTSSPDVSALHWETGPQGERRLMGLSVTLGYLKVSPDGRYLAATGFYHDETPSPAPSVTTMLLDLQGNEHRKLADTDGYVGFYEWTDDGRLLWWDDDGRVFLDDVNLNAPEPLRQIYAIKGNIAYLAPYDWYAPAWRIDLQSGVWQQIMGPDGPLEARFRGISTDGLYALYTGMYTEESQTSAIWRVPIGMDTAAEYVMDYYNYIFGTDAYLGPDTTFNIPGTNLWSIYGPFDVWIDKDNYIGYEYSSTLIDLDTKRVLAAEDFGLDPAYVMLGEAMSQDGMLELYLTKDPRSSPDGAIAVIDEVYTVLPELGLTTGFLEPYVAGNTKTSSMILGATVSDLPFPIVANGDVLEVIPENGDGSPLKTFNLQPNERPITGVLSPDHQTAYISILRLGPTDQGTCDVGMSLIAWDLLP